MVATARRRADLFGQVAALYADLGWAVPTCLEWAPIGTLEEAIRTARTHAAARRLLA